MRQHNIENYNSMINYINRNNILTDAQYGFHANKSTESALIDFTNVVYKGLIHKTSIGLIEGF